MKIKHKNSVMYQQGQKKLNYGLFGLMISLSVQCIASDIEIYQKARPGDITLMMMLDISISMGGPLSLDACDAGRDQKNIMPKVFMEQVNQGTLHYSRYYCKTKNSGKKYYQRITRLQEALFDLLAGNSSKKISPIADHYVIGLSTLGAKNSRGYIASSGAILVPARRLDAVIEVSKHVKKTQRQILLDNVAQLKAMTSTPTARAYAETVAYLMGNSTVGVNHNGFAYSVAESKEGDKYLAPESLRGSNQNRHCGHQGIYVLTDGEPNNDDGAEALMAKALNRSFRCPEQNSFSCLNAMARHLLDPAFAGFKIKTAVVGFGSSFNQVTSYDQHKTDEENIRALGELNTNVKKAAYWGIIGGGGWYSSLSSQDVVNSIHRFIDQLSSEIPAATQGSATIPTDALNPSALQNYAYYPQFQPTPDQGAQLWLGNLKKYKVDGQGMLRDKSNALLLNQLGKQDLWAIHANSSATQFELSHALIGGMRSQLRLQHYGNDLTQRKLFTTRALKHGRMMTSTQLRPIVIQDIEDDQYKNIDTKLGYLMNLLGYASSPHHRLTLAQLKQQAELRQVGAVMHSSPLLLTNQGRMSYRQGQGLSSSSRQDYVVFGTTQGLLHVVDAVTGKEKFAFVPNEMIESQAEAFGAVELSHGGLDQFFYGIDGAWTAYSEYVSAKNDADLLTVGEGRSYRDAHGQLQNTRGKQLIYGGLRMGGRDYYALDLSNIDQPKLQFQIHPEGPCSSHNPLGCMGQSWSKPKIGWVQWKGERKLVMWVGGGYDAGGEDGNAVVQGRRVAYAGYESDDYQQRNRRGAGIYMFDAQDGQLLWWASANAQRSDAGVLASFAPDLQYSVVSEIKTVDRDSDGLIDHLYFGDLAGQLWRIDLNNQLDADTFSRQPELFAKTPVRLLNLYAGARSPRFYSMPAFSTYSENGKIFALLSIGSGNRSQPLVSYHAGQSAYIDDAIFNLYDKDVIRQDLFKLSTRSGSSHIKHYSVSETALNTQNVTLQSVTQLGFTDSTNKLMPLNEQNRFQVHRIIAPYATTQGWYYPFTGDRIQTKKILSTPIIIHHDLYVESFDASKVGSAGNCGAGIKGESFMSLFCMPYGQCKTGSMSSHSLNLGAGIIGGAVGTHQADGMSRVIVTDKPGSIAQSIDQHHSNLRHDDLFHRHYQTGNKLIPQRWYERH